jgi:protein-disulfide isomerase
MLCLASSATPQSLSDSIRKDLDEVKSGQREILNLLRKLAATEGSQSPSLQGVRSSLGQIDVSGLPARGSEDAPITIVEISDYQCQFCQRHFRTTLPQIVEKYISTGDVRLVFVDMPNERSHPLAVSAAEAGRCAGAQGRFWEMHDRLFGGTLTDYRQLFRLADEIGLEASAFKICLDSGTYTSEVRSRRSALAAAGVSATPYFLIGTRDPRQSTIFVQRKIEGAMPFAVFQSTFDELLVLDRSTRRPAP